MLPLKPIFQIWLNINIINNSFSFQRKETNLTLQYMYNTEKKFLANDLGKSILPKDLRFHNNYHIRLLYVYYIQSVFYIPNNVSGLFQSFCVKFLTMKIFRKSCSNMTHSTILFTFNLLRVHL